MNCCAAAAATGFCWNKLYELEDAAKTAAKLAIAGELELTEDWVLNDWDEAEVVVDSVWPLAPFISLATGVDGDERLDEPPDDWLSTERIPFI